MLSGQRVMITGVCGTIGRELLAQLCDSGAEILGLDNNETELFMLRDEFPGSSAVELQICDVRDRDGLSWRCRGVDLILHAAAYKHVLVCEQSPRDAIQTNILGTQNVIEAALSNDVGKVLYTSTDKAVNPTSVMGTSKLMGERLITAANVQAREGSTLFTCSRFGNVLGSRGSVVPVFRAQIERGGPVSLTDIGMTRFVMTVDDAAKLVLEAASLAKGGEVFVTKMPIARIEDLAQVMIEEFAPAYGYDPESIQVDVVGARTGEKLYEELMNEEEVRRTVELEKHFVILPAFSYLYRRQSDTYDEWAIGDLTQAYNSSASVSMSKDDLRSYLGARGLLDPVATPWLPQMQRDGGDKPAGGDSGV